MSHTREAVASSTPLEDFQTLSDGYWRASWEIVRTDQEKLNAEVAAKFHEKDIEDIEKVLGLLNGIEQPGLDPQIAERFSKENLRYRDIEKIKGLLETALKKAQNEHKKAAEKILAQKGANETNETAKKTQGQRYDQLSRLATKPSIEPINIRFNFENGYSIIKCQMCTVSIEIGPVGFALFQMPEENAADRCPLPWQVPFGCSDDGTITAGFASGLSKNNEYFYVFCNLTTERAEYTMKTDGEVTLSKIIGLPTSAAVIDGPKNAEEKAIDGKRFRMSEAGADDRFPGSKVGQMELKVQLENNDPCMKLTELSPSRLGLKTAFPSDYELGLKVAPRPADPFAIYSQYKPISKAEYVKIMSDDQGGEPQGGKLAKTTFDGVSATQFQSVRETRRYKDIVGLMKIGMTLFHNRKAAEDDPNMVATKAKVNDKRTAGGSVPTVDVTWTASSPGRKT